MPVAMPHGMPAAMPPPASAMGMPVAVFPQGPPPPPPAPKQGAQHLNPNAKPSPSTSRARSPQPQNFEPPPMGCRPEIKIPPNPMAALRKVPPPKPKEVDWSEEFRKERSKSPMPPATSATPEPSNTHETQLPEPVREFNVQQHTPDKVDSPVQSFASRQPPIKDPENTFRDQNNNVANNNFLHNNVSNNNFANNNVSNNNFLNNNVSNNNALNNNVANNNVSSYSNNYNNNNSNYSGNYNNNNNNFNSNTSSSNENSNSYGGNFNQYTPPQRPVYSPFAASPQPNLPKPLSPVKLNQSSQDENIPIYVRSSQRAASEKPATPQYQPNQSSPISSFGRQASLEQPSSTPIYTRTARNVNASPVKQSNQTSTFQPNTNENENYPIYVRSFQRQQQPPASQQSQAPPPPAPTVSAAPTYSQKPMSTNQSSFIIDPGRQYVQSNRTTNASPAPDSSAQNGKQMPPWMRRHNSKELPEWANPSDDYSRTTAPQSSTFTNNNSNYQTNNSTAQYENNGYNSGAQQVT